jgi:hypothetical protein
VAEGDWYGGWVELHVQATGATAEAGLSLDSDAVRAVVLGEWGATAAELGAATNRLIAGLRVPKFASEHAEAVGRELQALRRERERARDGRQAAADGPPACRECGGTGRVTVALCGSVWEGRLVNHRTPEGAEYAYPISGAVSCDDCEAGRQLAQAQQSKPAGKKRLRTRAAHTRLLGGADGKVLWEEFERQRAARAREEAPPGAPLGELFAGLVAKARRGESGGF